MPCRLAGIPTYGFATEIGAFLAQVVRPAENHTALPTHGFLRPLHGALNGRFISPEVIHASICCVTCNIRQANSVCIQPVGAQVSKALQFKRIFKHVSAREGSVSRKRSSVANVFCSSLPNL
jgi:hypothetical protein